jgi:hypothetical protein
MATKLITELPLRGEFDDTVNVPGDDTIQTYRVTGAQIRGYLEPFYKDQGLLIKNVGLSISASAGAMTVALKQKNGSSNPTAGVNSTEISFRSNTLSSPNRTIVAFDSALSLVIPSGATLGYANGNEARVFIYAYFDGTNKGLCVSPGLLDESELHTILELNTNSDGQGLYGDAARSNAALRLLGEFKINSITTAGTWTTPNKSIALGPIESGFRPGLTRYFTTSGTWTKPAGLKAIEVEVIGGGGSGGGAPTTGTNQISGGTGGGGGGYARKFILASNLGDTVTVTVGAGGAASAAGGNGNDGGTSSFGSFCSANGGVGGIATSATTGARAGNGAAGGGASGGDLNVEGGSGGNFLAQGASGGPCTSGDGGQGAVYGSRVRGQAFLTTSGSSSGSSGRFPGGGSTGAYCGQSTSAVASNAGAAGIVIVKEYF